MKKLILLIFFISFLSFTVFADVCENNICEATENKDNCPYDCAKGTGLLRGNGEPTYRTKEVVIADYKVLCNKHSDSCDYEIIGKSLEGKDILMFKFGNSNGGRVMIDGEGHGMEDCGTESSLVFAKWMLESSDEEAVRARKNNYFMVIPIINMDEYRRQNARSVYPDGTKVSYGVDLNRNSPIGWGYGNKDPTSNIDYCGQSAGSEPETQAIVNAMKKYEPDVYINTHCGMWLWNYYPMNNVTQSVINKVKEISVRDSVDLSNYQPKSGCSGGHICRTGGTYGKSGWILEVSPWANLPSTLEGYHNKYNSAFHTIILGTLQAVEKQTPNVETPFSFSNLTVKQMAIVVIIFSTIGMLFLLFLASKIKKF